MIRIHYHRPGKGTTIFEEHLVLDRPDLKVTLLPRYDGDDVTVANTIALGRHAPIVWFVFPGTWRDVGRFHLADGTFTGWYTNLRRPMTTDGDDWFSTDLFLDHWLPAHGAGTWLDEDELEDACRRGLVDDATRRRLDKERQDIDDEIAAGTWPPPITREIDLAAARAAVAP